MQEFFSASRYEVPLTLSNSTNQKCLAGTVSLFTHNRCYCGCEGNTLAARLPTNLPRVQWGTPVQMLEAAGLGPSLYFFVFATGQDCNVPHVRTDAKVGRIGQYSSRRPLVAQ